MSQQEKKSIVILMLIAFLWSAVQPLFVAYAMPKDEGFFGERMLICTSKGFEWVSVSDLPDDDGTAKEERHLKCALCYFQQHYAVDWQLASYSLDMGHPWRMIGVEKAPDEVLRQTAPPYVLLPSRAPPVMA